MQRTRPRASCIDRLVVRPGRAAELGVRRGDSDPDRIWYKEPMRYDPYKDPHPDEWLHLDEQERMDLVVAFHRRKRIKMPSPLAHAALHTAVENQIALADETPVKQTLQRLMAEGLDRHEAVHAIATVLAELMHGLVTGKRAEEPNAYYEQKLRKLTADWWLHHWDDPDGPDED